MARLELLQSPACTLPYNKKAGIFFFEASHVCEIEDIGFVGCGFICERYLEALFGNTTASKRIMGIQIRVYVPNHGICKGMLIRKVIVSGPPIQLPSSMEKVLASMHPNMINEASLLICKNGVHPAPGTMNEYMGRKLDTTLKPPPLKGFKDQCKKKPLSDMILRLWHDMKVPEGVCSKYARKSLCAANRNHAWIGGFADPTGSLPTGHMFVPGLQKSTLCPEEVFITRSPCNKPVDGRVIPLVTTKPSQMSVAHWEWLNQLSFGGVIFANPKPGMMSIPEQIAKGDLDGDLYLVCWDGEILSHLEATPIRDDIPVEEDTISTAATFEPDPDWFQKAQELMIDARLVQVMGQLIGKLWTLSKAVADENKESDIFMAHPDAISFAEAYNQALEFGKHGGKVSLPAHLHSRLPVNLREYVVAVD
jgi:hypothetical protein